MVRPRVALLLAMTLHYLTRRQAARVRSSVSASLFVPRFWSLSNSGRTPTHPGPNVETDQPRSAVSCQVANNAGSVATERVQLARDSTPSGTCTTYDVSVRVLASKS